MILQSTLLALVAAVMIYVVQINTLFSYVVGSVFIISARALISAVMAVAAPGGCTMFDLPAILYLFARSRELDGDIS